MKPVRVRFAPSPTGPLHIGGVRTALFNYLFAKQKGGTFVLRIEDTDQSRYVPGAEDYIREALEWCGLQWDEGPEKGGSFGPYRQSERSDIYKDYADRLIKEGKAYYAFDSQESLEQLRKDHESEGKTFIYNWHNRMSLENSLTLPSEVVEEKLASGAPYVIRFLNPEDRTLELQDIVRGNIKIESRVLDDKILFKSDGMPTYHLANIVDDHLMEISHVIRGEEWLPSLPLHVLLYEAFGWDAPQFAHLPLIMKPVGKGKLSKRDGEKLGFPVFPLQWKDADGYRENGYFPEAVVNFLAMLGWNPGTEQEVFSMKELVSAFSLERVNKSGARFDPDKTKWYNQHYLQHTEISDLTEKFKPILRQQLKAEGVSEMPEDAYVRDVVEQLKERASFPKDFWELGDYYFLAPETYDAKALKKQWKENTPTIISEALEVIKEITDFRSESIETAIKNFIKVHEYSFGQVMPPLRLVIVGGMKGPHLFDIIATIGKSASVKRIEQALERLS